MVRLGLLQITMTWLALSLATTATAAPADATPAAAGEPDSVGSVVDLATDEATYRDARSCISMSAIRGHTILDGGHIVFHLPRGRYALSQLKPRCASLQRNDVIQLNPSSIASLCALDRVEVLRSVLGPGSLEVIDTCVLGVFEEISREQLSVLKAEVQSQR